MEQSKSRAVRAVAVVRPPHPAERTSLTGLVSVERLEDDDGYSIKCGDATFAFPEVYGYQSEDLDSLCSREVEPLLQGCLAGESAAIIAYGQTGAGKSYLCGTEYRKPDPWPNSVGAYVSRRIWEAAAEQKLQDLEVEVSFIEIYREGSGKETMLDLLGGFSRVPLHGYAGGSQIKVETTEELLDKLVSGSCLRNTDATDGNARSSRSHAIFTIKVRHKTKDEFGISQRVSGRLMLVDLAGAEAASTSNATNTALQRQGAGINVGLSALQLVIREVAAYGRTLHYRDSKLTHILKPALGGEGGREGCNAAFLGCVSPTVADAKRTQHTLQYMQQAGRIRNTVIADVEALEARQVAALIREREALKAQLKEMAAELKMARDAEVEATERSLHAADVVVLSLSEHQELLARRDVAAALEVVVQNDEERFSAIQKELEDAVRRAKVIEAANKQLASEGRHEDQPERPLTPVEEAEAAAAELMTPSSSQNSGQQHQQEQSAMPPGAAFGPAMAALAVSPILLAASRSSNMDLMAGTGGGGGGGGGGDSETPVIGADVAEPLDIDSVCLPLEISNLTPEQLEVLRKLAIERLERSAQSSTLPMSAASSTSLPALQGALRRRNAEVSALKLAVASYNECLGAVATELALARDSEVEALGQLQQAAKEKVQYVELVAKYQQALDVSQYDVLELQTEVRELKRSGASPGGHFSGSAGGGGGSGGGGGGGGNRLLCRIMGRPSSPRARTPTRLQSASNSPYYSPVKPILSLEESPPPKVAAPKADNKNITTTIVNTVFEGDRNSASITAPSAVSVEPVDEVPQSVGDAVAAVVVEDSGLEADGEGVDGGVDDGPGEFEESPEEAAAPASVSVSESQAQARAASAADTTAGPSPFFIADLNTSDEEEEEEEEENDEEIRKEESFAGGGDDGGVGNDAAEEEEGAFVNGGDGDNDTMNDGPEEDLPSSVTLAPAVPLEPSPPPPPSEQHQPASPGPASPIAGGSFSKAKRFDTGTTRIRPRSASGASGSPSSPNGSVPPGVSPSRIPRSRTNNNNSTSTSTELGNTSIATGAGGSRRKLLSNTVVGVSREEKELQKRMAGGVDAGAISGTRAKQVTQEFVDKNQHWGQFQQKKGTGSSTRRQTNKT